MVPNWFTTQDSAKFVEWRPASLTDSLRIFEMGGPLVDEDTGQVIVEAALPERAWMQLIGVDAPAAAAAAAAPKTSTPEHDAFALALAA